MSILSQAIKSYEGGTPLATVASNALTQIEQWGAGIISAAEQDPAVKTAINTAVTDAQAVASTAISWADTAIAGTLSDFGDEVSALVVTYGQKLVGSGASVGTIATLIGALVDAGVATVQHEALALQSQLTAPVVAAPQPAAE